jgi:hypothetical protein
MTHKTITVLSLSTFLAIAGTAMASPGVDVRSIGAGPITPGNAPAGPAIDPTTQNGQWFLTNNGLEDYRTHEFHDNISQFGGGPNEHLAIRGGFAGYTFSGNQVTGYQMVVSITNNTPLTSGAFASQPNMHGENRLTPWPTYSGDMYNVRFSAHWADDGNPLNFNQGGANIPSGLPGPTSTSPGTSNTFAVGYDALAWYSFTTGMAGMVGGSYQVPSWDFGNIPVGQTATQTLSFSFYSPLNIAAVPPPSSFAGQDLLIARSDDIRIGSYFQDDPVMNGIADRLAAYPNGGINPATSHFGNSSVFFSAVPTPGSAAVMVLGGLLCARRRR